MYKKSQKTATVILIPRIWSNFRLILNNWDARLSLIIALINRKKRESAEWYETHESIAGFSYPVGQSEWSILNFARFMCERNGQNIRKYTEKQRVICKSDIFTFIDSVCFVLTSWGVIFPLLIRVCLSFSATSSSLTSLRPLRDSAWGESICQSCLECCFGCYLSVWTGLGHKQHTCRVVVVKRSSAAARLWLRSDTGSASRLPTASRSASDSGWTELCVTTQLDRWGNTGYAF